MSCNSCQQTDFCCKTNTHVLNINISVAHVRYDLLFKSNRRNNHISPDAEPLTRQMLLNNACSLESFHHRPILYLKVQGGCVDFLIEWLRYARIPEITPKEYWLGIRQH